MVTGAVTACSSRAWSRPVIRWCAAVENRAADRVEDERGGVEQGRDDQRGDQPVPGARRHAVGHGIRYRADDEGERRHYQRPVERVGRRPGEDAEAERPARLPEQPPRFAPAQLAATKDRPCPGYDHGSLTYFARR
jgi:hypothetical protein